MVDPTPLPVVRVERRTEMDDLRSDNERLRESMSEWREIDEDHPAPDWLVWTLWDGIDNKTGEPARYYHAAAWHGDCGDWINQDGDVIDEPTHWMPLPPPPQSEQLRAALRRSAGSWFVILPSGVSRKFTSTEEMVAFLQIHPGCLVTWSKDI